MIETRIRPTGLDGRHGAYTYRLARAALGDRGLREAVDGGELVGFGRNVLLAARRALDPLSRGAGALLLTGPTGVLVGPTAAALHGCTAVGGVPVHVTLPYARRVRSRDGLVVHQGRIDPADTTTVAGLRMLTVEAAVTEVLCTAPRRAALAAADQAMHPLDHVGRRRFLAAIEARLARRTDRRGTGRGVELLALATGRPTTPSESALVLVLADAGLPAPVCRYPVLDTRGRPAGHLALAWPDARVALSVAGPVHLHAAPNPSGLGVTVGRLAAMNDAAPCFGAAPGQGVLDLESGTPGRTPPGWRVLLAGPADLLNPTALTARLRIALTERRAAA